MSPEASPYWPLTGLRLEVAALSLVPVAETDLDELADLMPLDLEMNPATPRPFGVGERVARGVALRQEHWQRKSRWTPEAWKLDFLVRHEGRVIGVQELEAEEFALLRTVETASFLWPDARGHGFGKLMRAAVLSLAFDRLDAEIALTEAWSDNAASLGVSRALGYQPNGSVRHGRDGQPVEMPRLRLDVGDWRSVPRPRVTITGLEPCLPWFLGPAR
jgi:RimJ/RimL family protein N-acetyltransferase